jgi:hypothetical protein
MTIVEYLGGIDKGGAGLRFVAESSEELLEDN